MKKPITLRLLVGWTAAICLPLSLANAQDVGDIDLVAYWNFEETAVDDANGYEGYLGGNAKYTDGEKFGFALDTSELEGSFFRIQAEDESGEGNPVSPAFFEHYNGEAGPSGRDQLTVVFWQRNTDDLRDQVGWWTVSAESGGSQRGAQGHTPWSNDNIYFDSAGCCDGATQRISAPSGVEDWMAWNHFAFVKNGENKAIWVNGEILLEGVNTDPLPSDMIAHYIGNGVEESRDQPGLIDEFAIIAGAASPEQIKELAEGATVPQIFDNSNPGINMNAGKVFSAGTLAALSTAQEIRFKIKNTIKPDDPRGPEVLTISSLEITGGDTDNFTLVSAPTSLDPNVSEDLVLSFNNKGGFGSFSVTMNVKSNDADADDQNIDFTVRASVVNPKGPVAHYRLDETNVADPATDTTRFSRAGAYSENGGAIGLGQAGLTAGTGTAAKFSGGSNVGVSSLPENILSSFTISMWINPASLGDLASSDFRTIVARGFDSPIFGLLEASGEFVWFGEADGVADALFLTDGLNIQPGTTYHVAMRYDGASQMGTFIVDGVEVGSGAVPTFADEGSLYLGSFGAGALAYDGTIDDVQVYDRALTTEEDIKFLIDNPGKVLVPAGPADSDQDGLSDEEEIALGTDVFKSDTDGDGLSDGDEVNVHSTDPLNPDTDGDGFKDGFEVANNTDPLVADIVGTKLLAFWDFDDVSNPDTAVDVSGGNVGRLEGAAYSADGAGRTGAAGDSALDGSAGQLIVDGDNAVFLNEAQGLDQITFSFWQNLNSVVNSSTFWTTAEGAGGDRAAQAHVSWGDGNLYFDTGGCCDGTQRISGAAPAGYDEGWHHYAFVKQAESKSVWVDGVKVFEGTNTAPLPENFTALYLSGEPAGANLVDGLIDEFAVFGSALKEADIVKLASGARADAIGGATIVILGTGAESLLGGDLTDPENDGLDALGAANDPSWNWVGITGNIEADFEGGENAFNIFDNKVGGGNDKWCCDDPTPDNPFWVSVEFADAVSLTHFTITNGNDTPDRDPTNWAIQGSNDGVNFENIFAETEVSIWSETRNEVALVTLGSPSAPYKHLRYIVFDTPGALHQLNEIEYFGSVGGQNVLANGSFEEPVLDNINTNNLGTVPTGWSQTGDDATWNLIRNDGTPYGSGVDNAADGSQIVDLNGVFELFQNFTLASDSTVTFGASFANREGHDGSPPSTVGIYDAAGSNLLSPEVSVDTSADPTPSEVWRSGEASVSLPAGEYQIRIALNNFNNVDAVFANASGGDPGPDPGPGPGFISDVVKASATAGGAVSFGFPAGATFDVQYSEDLVTWTVIANGVTGNFEDTDAGRIGSRAGFYRGVGN